MPSLGLAAVRVAVAREAHQRAFPQIVRFVVVSRLSRRESGDEGIRTPDPKLAKLVLSQLSYTPEGCSTTRRRIDVFGRKRVGLGRFELPTSRLSGVRSNQLSYRPECSPTSVGERRSQAQGIGPRREKEKDGIRETMLCVSNDSSPIRSI